VVNFGHARSKTAQPSPDNPNLLFTREFYLQVTGLDAPFKSRKGVSHT
jgi:hypothetical protein